MGPLLCATDGAMTAKAKHHGWLLDGLARALASPAGVALFASKTTAGLFPNTRRR